MTERLYHKATLRAIVCTSETKLPRFVRRRNKQSCVQSRRVVAVPVVVEPVDIPVPPAAVPVQIPDIQVAVRVAVAYEAPSMPPPFEYSRG